jgi:FHA domain
MNGSTPTQKVREPQPPPSGSGTGTDPRASEWAISDQVVQLRQVGTQTVYPLPREAAIAGQLDTGISLGSSSTCDIQIQDPLKRVSRHHAVLLFKNGYWNAVDVGSKNGLLFDGVKQCSARLTPGSILGLGSIRLVAESPRSIDLRCFLARLLGWGWGDEQDAVIERTMASIRQAQIHRAPIILESDSDLIPVALDLHRHLFGANRRFVVCDPKRRPRSDKDVRLPLNFADPIEASEAAKQGTLCVRAERLPRGFAELLHHVLSTESTTQLMVCIDGMRPAERSFASPIVIPSLRSRSQTEIAQVIREYFLDAIVDLDGPPVPALADRAWIMKHSATSLVEVAKGTRRLVALRKAKTLRGAAELLGMTSPSLSRWLQHRGGLPGFSDLDTDEGSPPGAEHQPEEDDEAEPQASDGVPAAELPAEESPSVEVHHTNGIPVIAFEERSTLRRPKRRGEGSE